MCLRNDVDRDVDKILRRFPNEKLGKTVLYPNFSLCHASSLVYSGVCHAIRITFIQEGRCNVHSHTFHTSQPQPKHHTGRVLIIQSISKIDYSFPNMYLFSITWTSNDRKNRKFIRTLPINSVTYFRYAFAIFLQYHHKWNVCPGERIPSYRHTPLAI